MHTNTQGRYLAIDFLHNDYAKASACAEHLAGGALQFTVARAHTIIGKPAPMVEAQYLLERRSLDAVPQRRLTLVANIAFSGDELNPALLQKEITRIGSDLDDKQAWNFGPVIRAAKLFTYGQDMFRRMDSAGITKLSVAVWPDSGNERTNGKVPRQRLGNEFFSLNTARAEPHWIGHVNGWGLKECAANNNDIAIDLQSVNLLTLEKR